jgi:hypothetical protein
MTKADLIDEVSRVSSLTKKETETIVNTVFDTSPMLSPRETRWSCGGSAASGSVTGIPARDAIRRPVMR